MLIVGATLAAAGFFFTAVVPFYFGACGLILFLISIPVVIASRARPALKVAILTFPIVAFYGYQPLKYHFGKAEPVSFLIPAAYQGEVRIVFRQIHGEPLEYEDGRRLLRINEEGLLLTQAARDRGFIDHRFYHVAPSGERTPLRRLEGRMCEGDGESIAPGEVGVFGSGITTRSGGIFPEPISYMSRLVTTCDSLHVHQRRALTTSRKDSLIVEAMWGMIPSDSRAE